MGQSYSRTAPKPTPPRHTPVPADWAPRLRQVRADLGLTQTQLAQRIGAAGKAVVYQWESRKRRPSPVFWTRMVGHHPRGPRLSAEERGKVEGSPIMRGHDEQTPHMFSYLSPEQLPADHIAPGRSARRYAPPTVQRSSGSRNSTSPQTATLARVQVPAV